MSNNKKLPVLPMKSMVVFPNMLVPIFIGRKKSLNTFEHAAKNKQEIVLVLQKRESSSIDDLYQIGVVGTILQMVRLPDGTVKSLVLCGKRCKVLAIEENDDILSCNFDYCETSSSSDSKNISKESLKKFEQYINQNNSLAKEIYSYISKIKNQCELADAIAGQINIEPEKKQDLLETLDVTERFQKILSLLSELLEKHDQDNKPNPSLSEHIKMIQKDISHDPTQDEIKTLEEKANKTNLSKEAKEKIKYEISKLRSMNGLSAEAGVVRNYIETVLSMPWSKMSKVECDIEKAKESFDKECYGLEELKRRAIEYIATYKRVGNKQNVILCFLGPPGVGKTAFAKQMAQIMGRKFARISLGGVRDEADIRGHRRTYVGSMPGNIIQSIQSTKTDNPIILLDEIEKIDSKYGNPAAALLEVLDPNQNTEFKDHYLDLSYDISNVTFIATANSLDMMPALRDRMEIITISGYTEDEKIHIANKHLIPKQMNNHGVKESELQISSSAMRTIIREYTKESGVRSLDRQIAKIMRQFLTLYYNDKKSLQNLKITGKNLSKYLGIQKYSNNINQESKTIGISIGMAWTETGGEILHIESALSKGSGKIVSTGKLGEVMQESISIVISYLKSRSDIYELDSKIFKDMDLHIHVPDGATPKDGPSAGIAIFASVLSTLTRKAIDERIAMTGEITLLGRVLPIGGLKEKILAAHRNGIRKIIIPKDNKKDLVNIPKSTLKDLEVTIVSRADEIIPILFGIEQSFYQIDGEKVIIQ